MRRAASCLALAVSALLLPATPAMADPVPPTTFTIVHPLPGDVLRGTAVRLQIRGTTGYDCGTAPSAIDLFVDGQLFATTDYNAGCLGNDWPLNIDTTRLSNGPHQFSVRDQQYDWNDDPNGANAYSQPITVSVANIAPTALVVSPAAGAIVSGLVTETADVQSDPQGSQHIVKVDFLIDGTVVATDNLAPYTYSWNTRPYDNTDYELSVRAYDSAGLVGTSPISNATVANYSTTAALTTNHDRVARGHAATLTAKLFVPETESALGSRAVSLQFKRHAGHAWATLAVKRTGSSGKVAFRVTPTVATDYRVKFAGDPEYSASTSHAVSVATVTQN